MHYTQAVQLGTVVVVLIVVSACNKSDNSRVAQVGGASVGGDGVGGNAIKSGVGGTGSGGLNDDPNSITATGGLPLGNATAAGGTLLAMGGTGSGGLSIDSSTVGGDAGLSTAVELELDLRFKNLQSGGQYEAKYQASFVESLPTDLAQLGKNGFVVTAGWPVSSSLAGDTFRYLAFPQ